MEKDYFLGIDEGCEERLALIERYIPGTREVISRFSAGYMSRTLAGDDILDAVVLALGAASKGGKNYSVVPCGEEKDIRGIPMKIFIPFTSDSSL